MVPDHKPLKPAAPVVPPKKPIPPPGKARLGAGPPKRPDKPLASSPATPASKLVSSFHYVYKMFIN